MSEPKQTPEQTVLDSALELWEAGGSIIPTMAGKAPALSTWTELQSVRLPREAVEKHFSSEASDLGIGLIAGPVSNGAFCFDFDGGDEPFRKFMVEVVRRFGDEFANDHFSIIRTPRESSGYHVWIRTNNPPSGTTLAKGAHGECLVESRGSGQYALVPGGRPGAHATGRRYVHIAGLSVVELLAREADHVEVAEKTLECLIDVCRTMDETKKRVSGQRIPYPTPPAPASDDRPGTRFNRAVQWSKILPRHGWVHVETKGDEERWRRPGKDTGTSATIGFCQSLDGISRLKVFSSNASPFEAGETYSKFEAFALLEHGGDRSAAGKEIDRFLSEHASATSIATKPPPSPFVPFPIEVLPTSIAAFIANTAATIGCDPSFVALPVLVELGVSIGITRMIRLKHGWSEPPIIWCAIVGDSGSSKSPAMEAALRPLRDRQASNIKDHAEVLKGWKAKHLAFEAELTAWKREAAKRAVGLPPEEPQKPSPIRHYTGDTTTEALAALLAENPRGVAVVADELAGWLGSFDRYSAGGSSDASRWLELYGARALTIDRKTSDPIHIARAAAWIVGGIQPGVLARTLGNNHRENGLLARVFLAMPPRRPKRWTEAEADRDIERDFEATVEGLLRLEPEEDDRGEPRPQMIGLEPEAQSCFARFVDELGEETVLQTGDVAAAASKIEGGAARLALIDHLSRVASGEPVGDRVTIASMRAGITLARWFLREACRVFRVLDENETEGRLRRRAEAIAAKGGVVTVRDWNRWGLKGEWKTRSADAARAELQQLVDADMGTWKESAGRSPRTFRLVPNL